MMHASQSSPDLGHDLLDDVEVVVACNLCGETYAVRASAIRESQRVLASGCSGGSLHECTASHLATLVDPGVLDELVHAWQRFEHSATHHGGVGVVLHPARVAPARSSDLDAVALQRWENEGGHVTAA